MSAHLAADGRIEQAASVLRSDRFRQDREVDWRRLEAIVAKLEKGRMRRIDDEELMAMPVLYRTATSSLAVARETSLDAATVHYLEGLVTRAWFQIYGPRTGLWPWLRSFFGGGWSRRIRDIWLDIAIAFSVMVVGTIVGWLLCAQDEAWYYRIVPPQMAGTRGPEASREQLAQTIFGSPGGTEGGLGFFAASLFSNNAGVSILAFALGFAFGVPTLLLLLYNTALLGAMLWLFWNAGLGLDFAAWLAVHGTTELGAIMLGGAAGLHVGRAMALPGGRTILAATRDAGRRAAVVMVGVVLMMIIAALLEGFVRQLVTDTPTRALIGGSMLVLWIAYFVLAGHGRSKRTARADTGQMHEASQ